MNTDLSLSSLIRAIESFEASAASEADRLQVEPTHILLDPWAVEFALADRRKRRRMWRKMKLAGRVQKGRVIL